MTLSTVGDILIAIGVAMAFFVSLIGGIIVAAVGVVVRVWARQRDADRRRMAENDLIRLHELSQRGLIPQDEYEARRGAIDSTLPLAGRRCVNCGKAVAADRQAYCNHCGRLWAVKA